MKNLDQSSSILNSSGDLVPISLVALAQNARSVCAICDTTLHKAFLTERVALLKKKYPIDVPDVCVTFLRRVSTIKPERCDLPVPASPNIQSTWNACSRHAL